MYANANANANQAFQNKRPVEPISNEQNKIEKVEEELKDVSTNFPKYKSLVNSLLSTILVFAEQSVTSDAENELLSEKILPLSTSQKNSLSKFNDVFDVNKEYVFKDLAKNSKGENDLYTYDKRRWLTLAAELIRIFGDKKLSFIAPSIKNGDLEVKPVSAEKYAFGVPFLLSCLPNFCDFVGGFGGSYPASEYMTDKAISMKVYNKEQYVGNFNLWQTSEGDYIIGTIAIPRNNKAKNFGEKFKALLNNFSLELLMKNKEANNVCIGPGGANISTLNSKLFNFSEDKDSGYEWVKSIRHLDDFNDIDGSENKNVSRLEHLSNFDVANNIKLAENDPTQHDEYYMGMSADERKDFKNATVYTTRDKLAALKQLTKNEDKKLQGKPKQKTVQEIKAERAAKFKKK